MPKLNFSNREDYRVFIKGCKIFLKGLDDGECPFEKVIMTNLKRSICFSTPNSCLKYCGYIFPEIYNLLEYDEDCPCTIALGQEHYNDLDEDKREEMIQSLIKTRVAIKLAEVYESYKSKYLNSYR